MTVAVALALGACESDSESPGSAGLATLKVVATTSGAVPDADGYVVSVADRVGSELGANAEWSVGEVTPGAYTVQLSGIAANCTVDGDNPRSIVVETGRLATITFAVASTASVRILTETTGIDADASGFLVTIGTGAQARVPTSGSLVVSSTADGTLPLKVSDVAANCTPDPGNPTTIAVAEAITDVTLRFNCATALSAVRVSLTTNTWGAECDTLIATLDGQPRLLIEGTFTLFEDVPPGPHVVGISGLPAECFLRGESTIAVTATALQTARVSFWVDGII